MLFLLILILPIAFYSSAPKNIYYEWKNPENIENNIINSNNVNFSILSHGNNECYLSFVERVKKYIFTEEGDEINIQTKYLNKGNSNNCTLEIELPENFVITEAKIEGGNNFNYQTKLDNIVEFNFNLKSNNYSIISHKIINKENKSKFYRTYYTYIDNNTKYTFRTKQPLEFFGIENGRLKEAKQKNGAIYYYHNESEKYNFYETLHISIYGIKYKSDLYTSIELYFWQKFGYLTVPNLHEFGNNEIISNKVYSNINENKIIIEKNKKFITVKADIRGGKLIFEFSKEFQSKLDNKWILDGVDLENTCTTKARNKVAEILSNKNSQEKDYIILGKWVYQNIEYNSKYAGAEWTVDQILEKRTGVCEHITILYNAFLNCINIDAVYTKGFAYIGEDNNIDINSRHAWTVAKIDGNWVPLDATNNIFFGKLPMSHIFRYYGEIYRETTAEYGLFGSSKKEMKGILGVSQPVYLKIKATNFISRELEDDNVGDFELTLDNDNDNDTIIYIIRIIIILIYVIVIIYVIIVIIIACLKNKKRKRKNNGELGVSLSIN